ATGRGTALSGQHVIISFQEASAMLTAHADFTSILIQRKLLTPVQLEGARQIQRQTGGRLEDVLIQFGYTTRKQLLDASGEHSESEFLDLSRMAIPPEIIEQVPESVARENVVIPVQEDDGVLTVAVSDLDDVETIEKLEFILNKEILPVLALREQILDAIDRHYGRTETESVDSVLAEFTDTAIDFSAADVLSSKDTDL